MKHRRFIPTWLVLALITLAPFAAAQDEAAPEFAAAENAVTADPSTEDVPAEITADPGQGDADAPAAEEADPAGAAAEPASGETDFPNVVLIVLDTTRADHLGCYGYKQPASPGLDKYAEQGVVFEQVVTPATWTRPAHGAMLTGLYPRTLGLYVERNEILDDRFTTLAEVLKGAGYTTFGLTANPNINSVFNFQQGFDRYVDSNVVFGWMPMDEDDKRQGPNSLPSAPELFANALDMAENSPAPESPHYIQINVMEPHEWTAVRPGANMLRKEYDKHKFVGRFPVNRYPQLIRQVTDDMDAFIQQLVARPGWEDTLFIFTSDHGEGLDDHPGVSPSMHHGKLMYESQVLVPWIMYRNGWEPATKRVAQRVRLMEVFPTVLDYLGLPIPEGIIGKSMMPVLSGAAKSVPLPNLMVLESYFKGADIRAIYGKKFIYIETPKPNKGHDQKEVQPRAAPQNGKKTNEYNERPNVVRGMSRHLEQWEKKFPKVDPTPITREVSNEEIEQLKSIGYL